MRGHTPFLQVPAKTTDYGGVVEQRRFLRTDEAAAYLAVSPKTLEALRIRGGGPRYMRPSGRRLVLYAIEDLDAWARAGERASTSDTTPEER
jgi:excisionase family DNA binding protein